MTPAHHFRPVFLIAFANDDEAGGAAGAGGAFGQTMRWFFPNRDPSRLECLNKKRGLTPKKPN